jgi:CO dehydrogenase maturation factor
VAASLVRLLLDRGLKPVLAVDADPNSTLAPLLGLAPGPRISDIREEILEAKEDVSGIPKERMLQLKLDECIVEAKGFDMLTMGRGEGQDCYCYVNSLLRRALASMRGNYKVTVVDNEAGMEHLSRMNTDSVDCLVVVAEPTMVSARSAARIVELAGSLPVKVKRHVLVWNKVTPRGIPDDAVALLAGRFAVSVSLPFDEGVARLAACEESALKAVLPPAFERLFESCIINNLGSSVSGAKGES